jgi:hypothetical protein
MNHSFSNVSRVKRLDGVAIPAFIRNGQYFFVDLHVFEDGVVECWELTDLPLFGQKLQKGWVRVAVPDGESISIHGLGAWKIAQSRWLYDANRFYEHVLSLVKEMNPSMSNLYQYRERKINGVIIGENAKGQPYREKKPGEIFSERVKGSSTTVFYQQRNQYYLVELTVFADESVEISRLPQKEIFSLPQLSTSIQQGTVCTQLPAGASVEIFGLGSFVVQHEEYSTSIEDKFLEVKDTIEELNGRPTSIQRCRQLFEEYLQTPTLTLKDQLRLSYEAIPVHQRRYVGDMDTKDIPVRMIIYGKQEQKRWSHYQMSKKMGLPLPSIQVPKPKDDK